MKLHFATKVLFGERSMVWLRYTWSVWSANVEAVAYANILAPCCTHRKLFIAISTFFVRMKLPFAANILFGKRSMALLDYSWVFWSAHVEAIVSANILAPCCTHFCFGGLALGLSSGSVRPRLRLSSGAITKEYVQFRCICTQIPKYNDWMLQIGQRCSQAFLTVKHDSSTFFNFQTLKSKSMAVPRSYHQEATRRSPREEASRQIFCRLQTSG